MNGDIYPELNSWQQKFLDQFLLSRSSKSLLVAQPGIGKTRMVLLAAKNLIEAHEVDCLLLISDARMIRDQWRDRAGNIGLNLETSISDHLKAQGVAATLQSLRTKNVDVTIDEAARAQRWFIVADNPFQYATAVDSLVHRMLSLNGGSKALFLSHHVPVGLSFDAEFRLGTEFIFEPSILEAPETEVRVAKFAPSFALLRKLQKGLVAIDAMSWREFERLIATLLENDGYEVELMNGTKDGGVDVVAVKDLGPHGSFKALWQAKKKALTQKVGISVVRELADTRQELGASKGIIVTSSYLTGGALERINRDKYLLGKVDRHDLENWISRTLFGTQEGRAL